jgi:hypothetical protein
MNFIQSKTEKKTYVAWLLQVLILVLGLFMAFMGLTEFYDIKFGGQESAYAFGAGDNVDDWLYKTASHYSNFMLILGLLSLFASIITIISLIKKKEILVFISLAFIILLFIVDELI